MMFYVLGPCDLRLTCLLASLIERQSAHKACTNAELAHAVCLGQSCEFVKSQVVQTKDPGKLQDSAEELRRHAACWAASFLSGQEFLEFTSSTGSTCTAGEGQCRGRIE